MEHKVLEIKEAVVEDSGEDAALSGPGIFKGYGSVFGSVDRVNDRIVEGAYKDTIPSFLKDGFIGWGHDWNDPVATIDQAEERAKGLWIEATFHSHPEAQRARGIVKERFERGKSMGLSIGYQPVEWKWVKDEGNDMEVREITKIDLFEVSLVTVPAEPKARVSSVKALRDAGAGLAVEEWAAVLTELKEGRVLSGRNVERLKASAGKLSEILQEIQDLLSEAGGGEEDTPKGGDGAMGLAVWAEFMQTRMRLSGVR